MTSSIKLDNVRLEHADSRSDKPAGPADPGHDAKDKFDEAMTGRKDERRQEGESGRNGEKDGQGQTMPSASSLLGSLFESRMSGAGAARGPAAAGDVDELVDKLVQRILVSEPETGKQAEVRLQLSDGVLRDTEVVLQRGLDGLLSVRLVTDNASSMQTLVSAQQALKEQLEKHGPAVVRVETPGESRSGDNDANRRSQGMIDYEPENV